MRDPKRLFLRGTGEGHQPTRRDRHRYEPGYRRRGVDQVLGGFLRRPGGGSVRREGVRVRSKCDQTRSLKEHLVPVILRNPEIRRLKSALAQSDSPRSIVPRGLRSFQTEDSDFFLEILPAPVDMTVYRLSLRFWKTRIEERPRQHVPGWPDLWSKADAASPHWSRRVYCPGCLT